MDKAVLIIDMPACCGECFALDDNYDYSICIITQEQRGYTFNIKKNRMSKCLLVPITEETWSENNEN